MSLSVNPDIRLFDEGTDPDDVRKGTFADAWLLSALSMISAATVGDGGVDEQVNVHYMKIDYCLYLTKKTTISKEDFYSDSSTFGIDVFTGQA